MHAWTVAGVEEWLLWITMTIRSTGTRGLLRALALLAVLTGVFTMHALTANHHSAMSVMSSAQGMDSENPYQGGSFGTARMADPMPGPEAPAALSANALGALHGVTTQVGPAQVGAVVGPRPNAHSTASVCLAVLSATLLLLGIALAWRWAAWVVGAPLRSRTRRVALWLGRSPPWLAPSLSKLCVLRI